MKFSPASLLLLLASLGACRLAAADLPSNPSSMAEDSQDAQPIQSLTLADARATALRNHPHFATAQIQAMISQEIVREARSGFFPTIEAYGTGVDAGNENTRILAGGLNNPSIYDRVAGGVGASQLITDFGHTSNLTAGSKLEARADARNVEATREQILLNVDVAYFATLQDQALLQVARQTMAARQFLVDQVSALAAHQLKSQLDVSFSEVALEEARLLLQKSEGDADSAQASLAMALGFGAGSSGPDRPPATLRWQPVEPAPRPAPPPDIPTAIALALRDRPDLLGLRDQRDAATRFANAEKDLGYPTVSAVGTVGDAIQHDYHLPGHYAAGGIMLDVPLFTGGLYAARQRAAVLKAQAADEDVRDAEDHVTRDVQVAWLNLRTADQRLVTTERLLSHAVQADQLAQARYKVGSSSIVELSDAEVDRTSAEIAEAGARYDTLIARSILDYQMGALR